MALDEAAAIEMVVTHLKLSEEYVRSVPVWTFYGLVDRAKQREEEVRTRLKGGK